ncbi:MAG: membrane protein [Fimbriimonadales bacterium]|nr:MAG: membrane protein [Fimbriimonadales bacterium]
MAIWLAMLLAFLFVLMNGFFVAAEFAVVKARGTRMEELASHGSRAAKLVLHIMRHLDEYLSACQLGITLASIALGWIGEPVMEAILAPVFEWVGVAEAYRAGVSFAVGYAVISAAHIVIGEMAPKSLAIQRAESLSLLAAYPLHWFSVLFKPAIWLLNEAALLLLRVLGLRDTTPVDQEYSEAELQMLLSRAGAAGGPAAIASQLALQSLEFASRTVADVLVPRVDVVFLDINDDLEENRKKALEHPFSRYPVCDGSPDSVLGIVHVKDLVRLPSADAAALRTVIRPAPSVPESKPLPELLKEFQRYRVHMAIVVDEYGGMEGIVTLEDVLEEIVGEIADEYDVEEAEIARIGRDTWIISARARLEDINEQLGTSLESDTSDTLGGLIFDHLGRRPRLRDSVRIGEWLFVVDKMEDSRIKQIRARRLGPPPADRKDE